MLASHLTKATAINLSSLDTDKTTTGSAVITTLSPYGALKRGLVCWLVIYAFGMLAELSPFVHFFLPPLWIIVGPYAFLKVFRGFSHNTDIASAQGTCPCCGELCTTGSHALRFPLTVDCNHCKRPLSVNLDGTTASALKATMRGLSDAVTEQMVQRLPWPLRTRARARMIPHALIHLSVLAFAIVSFLAIRWLGTEIFNSALSLKPALSQGSNALSFSGRLIGSLAAIVIAAKVCGALFRKFNQPPVMGEVIAGVLLGPSFLGYYFPALQTQILAKDVSFAIKAIAEVGIVLFMALVGMNIDLKTLEKKAHTSVAVSHASIIFPFLGGCIVSLGLYKNGAPEGVSFTIFSLFIGTAMSITAFPVLARIINDLGIERKPLGIMAIACASVDDVTAWCLLALVISLSQSSAASFVACVFGFVLFLAVFWSFARPFILKLASSVEDRGELSAEYFAIMIGLILICALLTEMIGVHPLFGAFVVGVIIPRDSRLAQGLQQNLENVVLTLLLPAFFAYSGLRTEIGLLQTPLDWFLCSLVVFVAVSGKIGGAFFAARLTGLGVRDSFALGALMNARGLVELVVLNIGLDLGIINPSIFTMMVIMALVTTMMTGPLVSKTLALTFTKSVMRVPRLETKLGV